ncbi:MAG: RNA pseudouridine synthase, partial [Bacteroidia bacterium]|nr:RNA pseudouridine synthase [Bacteroidia bacterium]MDW8159394.1 RNA pseudouridine synthase [Bacteroidia bacterium]
PSQDDITQDLSVIGWAKNYLKVRYEKRGNVYLALLHRIDRPVSGVIMLAKTSKAAARLSKQFQEGKIKKEYIAVTERIPPSPSGRLIHYLKKIPGRNIMRAYLKEIPHSQEAILDYEVWKLIGKRALLKIIPHTGRQHQIRVQLASIGCPICGDVKYGKTNFLPDLSILLCCYRLTFEHPILKMDMCIQSQVQYNCLLNKLKQ